MVNFGRFSSSRIFLIGYMASGKSSIGRVLAAKLNIDFLDTDKAIEELKGQSISEIFETSGEAAFRREERKMLSLALNLENIVVATGGGMPIESNHIDLMNQAGTTIFLETDLEILIKRISENGDRPLHSDTHNIKSYAEKLFNKRRPIYAQAHYRISSNGSIAETTELILQTLDPVK